MARIAKEPISYKATDGITTLIADAGQPIPPDLDHLVSDHLVVDGHLAGLTVSALTAEADRRGLQVTGTGQNGNVVKADLLAALQGETK